MQTTPAVSKPLESRNLVLSAQDVGLSRGPRLLFSGLNFSIKTGEALVLRGANGSGKTSLLRVLAGLTTPDQGRATWCGARCGDKLARGNAIYLGHTNALKDDFTAAENLADALAFDGASATISVGAQDDALAKVGLAERRNVLARRLSQGQKRRVGLARLMLASQPLWLLDEPTNALDADGVALFEAIVNSHLAAGGLACIATHLPLAFGNAGRELFLDAA
jgi:heme exporter protein A